MLKIDELFEGWSPFGITDPEKLWDVVAMLETKVGKENYFGEGTEVQQASWVRGPARFGKNCQVRHAAFVGANFYTEDNVAIGHVCEVSNSYVGAGTHIAHMNFVGHSIIGRNCNLGAGVKIANSKVHLQGLKRGAIIGDNVFIGIGALIYPGTVIGKNCWVYPGAILRGIYESGQIIKMRQEQKIVLIKPEK